MQADKRDVRVFTVGFGDDVNKALLARLAARKRGRFTYIAAAANIEREVSLLYRQIDAPVLVDVSLEASGGAVSRLYPPTLPDLFVDDELRISGRLRASGPVTLTIKGKQGGRTLHAIDQAGRERRDQAALGGAAVGGRARRRSRSTRSRWAATGPRSQSEVLDLALAYNFATPYTAFLAIPASELDWQSAHALANARAYKAEHPQAQARRGARRRAQHAGRRRGGRDAGRQPDLDSRCRAQPCRRAIERELAANDSAESENPLDSPAPVRRMKLGHGSQNKSGEEQGGCASCAVGGRDDAPLAALAFAGVVDARRLRPPPPPLTLSLPSALVPSPPLVFPLLRVSGGEG